jgi:MFS transporter, VNT family, synaptic vesicle glycoprotein 2
LLPLVKTNEADFELAIESTGYGKFHYMLLLIAMPCCFASVFETTAMSLILPSAECDLNLSLVDKGMLNAITYAGKFFIAWHITSFNLFFLSPRAGMISSAFLWGFLSDVLGRKKLLVYGYLLDAMFNILCAFSQSFLAILVFKFMGGFV